MDHALHCSKALNLQGVLLIPSLQSGIKEKRRRTVVVVVYDVGRSRRATGVEWTLQRQAAAEQHAELDKTLSFNFSNENHTDCFLPDNKYFCCFAISH